MSRASVLALIALLAPAQPLSNDAISAASLRGHVSFLASDALEGRDTPSRGLDVAAEYIVSEFRRAGLESPPGLDYAQEAEFLQITDASDTAQFSISGAGEASRSVPPSRLAVVSSHAAHLLNEPIFKWAPGTNVNRPLVGITLILRAPSERKTIAALALSHPDCIVELTRKAPSSNSRAQRLIPSEKEDANAPVMVRVPEGDLESVFDRLPLGLTSARASVQVERPVVHSVRLRNLIGILRGSDPKLRDEYVIVSAHYDHLGLADSGKDRVFNGANDNASGVASLLEVAKALAEGKARPGRSLVFLCFFGEEKGLFGSTWYVQHPVFPLSRTVADINLEQLGLPDPNEGIPAGSLGVTGFGFTDMPQLLEPAFEQAGVTLRDASDNVDFFERSDNLAFARAGVPAHTFAAAFTFPDYHRVSDEWPKLDYENLANLTRGLARALLTLANSPTVSQWKGENKKTQEYLKAWRTLHP